MMYFDEIELADKLSQRNKIIAPSSLFGQCLEVPKMFISTFLTLLTVTLTSFKIISNN